LSWKEGIGFIWNVIIKKGQINVVVATFKSATQNKRVVTYVYDNAYNEEPQASDVIALVKFNVPNKMHMKRECEH
jgi:hypothetical protein